MKKLHDMDWVEFGSAGGRTVSITELLEEKVEMLEKQQKYNDGRIKDIEDQVYALQWGVVICALFISIISSLLMIK